MKSRLIVITALLLGVITVYAQDFSEKKGYFKFGPKFGLDLNTDINNLPSGEDIMGELEGNYQVALFGQIGRRLYLQPEVVYAVQSVTDDNGDKQNYEYLRVPFHLGVKLFDIGLLSLHISGGAIYTHSLSTPGATFDMDNLNYQIGVGVDIFDFITTDIRYTLAKDVPFADQISNFTENGGLLNITVGLKL